MSDNDNITQMGLDAGDYFAEVNKLIEKNKDLEKSLVSLGRAFIAQAKSMGDEVTIFQNLSDQNKDLAAALVALGGSYEYSTERIEVETKALIENVKARSLALKIKDFTDKTQGFEKSRDTSHPLNAKNPEELASLQENARLTEQLIQFELDKEAAQRHALETAREVAEAETQLHEKQKEQQEKILNEILAAERREKDLELEYHEKFNAANQRLLNQRLEQERQLHAKQADEKKRLEEGAIRLNKEENEKKLAFEVEFDRRNRDLDDRRFQEFLAEEKRRAEVLKAQQAQYDKFAAGRDKFVLSEKRAAKESEESAARILNSWKLVTRLFVVQTLHTALGTLISDWRQSIRAASEFEIKISEIRTISQDNQLSFQKWSGAIRSLSDQFGKNVNDVAAGAYETISNQIAKGADAALFMKKALEFAQTTVSSTEESVNLLSSALNSYGLTAADTDRVSAILFKTIDLGRVKASELANTFGRTTALAAPLGVSLEEVAAAIATLTIKGVKYNEAYTQINNILLKLVNPTKEMTKFLNGLGFSSGQAAISGLGFAGVLREVEKASNGNIAELHELFNEMRGLRGIVGLTGSAFGNFEQDLQKIKNSAKDFDIAKTIAGESAGRSFEIEMNRIKNIFINDFGQPFIAFVDSIGKETDASGKRIHGFSDNIRGLVNTLTAAGAAFIAYKGATYGEAIVERVLAADLKLTNAQLRLQEIGINNVSKSALRFQAIGKTLVSSVFNPITLITLGAGALVEIWLKHKQALDEVAESYHQIDVTIAEEAEKVTKITIGQINRENDAIKNGLDQRFQSYINYAAQLRRQLTVSGEAELKIQKDYAKQLKDVFDFETKQLNDDIHKTEQQINASTQTIKRIQEEIFRVQEGLTKGRFDRQIKYLPEPAQIELIKNKIQELQREQQRLLEARPKDALKTQQNFEASLKISTELERLTNELYDRRNEAEKKRKEVVDKIKELEARTDAQANLRQQRDAIQKISEIENQLRGHRSGSHAELIAQLEEQKRRLIDLKEVSKDEEGDRRHKVEMEKLQSEKKVLDATIQSLGSRVENEKQITSLTEQRVKMLLNLEEVEKKRQADEQKRLEQQKKNLEEIKTIFNDLAGFKVPTKADDKTSVSGILGDFDKKVTRLKELGGADSKILYDIAKQRAEIEKIVTNEIEQYKLDKASETLDQLKKKIESQSDSIRDSRSGAENLRASGIARLIETGKDIEKAAKSSINGGLDKGVLENLSKAIDGLKTNVSAATIKGVQDALAAVDASSGRFLSGGFLGIGPRDLSHSFIRNPGLFDDKGLSVADVLNQGTIGLNEVIKSLGQDKEAAAGQKALDLLLKQQEVAKQQLNQVQTQADQFMTAGEKYGIELNNLSQKTTELVRSLVDAKARIDANFTPNIVPPTINFSNPSGTGNTSIGNININLNSTGNTQTDAKAVANAINDGIRRGQIKIGR